MRYPPLSEALEAEHEVVDAGIKRFRDAVANGISQDSPLSETLAETLTLLRRHIYVEEEFLFPPLREAGMIMPILVMIKEHGEIWDLMDQLEQLATGSSTEAESLALTQQLLDLLDKHNQKEEPIIYPQVDLTLSSTATAELNDFLSNRSMPEGWICEKART